MGSKDLTKQRMRDSYLEREVPTDDQYSNDELVK
jgi:hypothetical protein